MNTAVQMKTSSPQEVRKQTRSAFDETAAHAELAGLFLQVMMSLTAQPSEKGAAPAGGTVGAAAAQQPGEWQALSQSPLADAAAFFGMPAAVGTDAESNSSGGFQASARSDLQALVGFPPAQAHPAGSIETQAGEADFQPAVSFEEPMLLEDASVFNGLLAESGGGDQTTPASPDALPPMDGLPELSGKGEPKPLPKDAGMQAETGESGPVQDGLSQAVVKARQMLSEQLPQERDSEDVDVDRLENELAKAKAPTSFRPGFGMADKADEPKLPEQIADGIRRSISLGKSEFEIRLKPEALGEITIRLVEEAGKTTLLITAAKEQTAKLINSEIAALREAVAPMNAEVRDAVASAGEAACGSMQQFDLAGHQFAGQQFSGRQNFPQTQRTEPERTVGRIQQDRYAPAQTAPIKTLAGNRLDAYV